MAVDNAFDDWQSQAAAIAVRGNHRIEYPRNRGFRYSRTAVFDHNRHSVSCGQANCSVRWCFAQSIQYKIQQHSMQQFVICNQSAGGVAYHIEPDVLLRGQRLNQCTNSFKQRVH